MKKVLLTATVQSHIAQFHKPLINMLKERGYEVHVAAKDNLAEKNGLKLDEPDKIFNIPFDRSPLSRNNILAYQKLKKILYKNKYDIVHCNTPMGGVITRLVANKYRKKGLKIFYTVHGFHFYNGGPKKNWFIYYPIEKWLAHYTDKLITITKEDYKLAKSKFDTEVVYIHGVGANSDRYYQYNEEKKEELRKQFGYKNNDFILLCTGELNKNKNQSTVIRAVLKVREQIPNIKLLLAGNGPMEKELKHLVSDINMQDVVDFLGYRTDLEKFVNICDVVISASFREGLPLNIMEGMLCGKPVVVSNNRGHSELVKDGINGFIVNPANSLSGFIDNINRLFKDRELRRIIGASAITNINLFKEENVIIELKNIYEIG